MNQKKKKFFYNIYIYIKNFIKNLILIHIKL